MAIYLQQTWVNDEGVVLLSRLRADPPDGELTTTEFLAQAQGTVPLGPGASAPVQFEFPVPGGTVEEAFANYPAALAEAQKGVAKKAQEEYRKALLRSGTGRLLGGLNGGR